MSEGANTPGDERRLRIAGIAVVIGVLVEIGRRPGHISLLVIGPCA